MASGGPEHRTDRSGSGRVARPPPTEYNGSRAPPPHHCHDRKQGVAMRMCRRTGSRPLPVVAARVLGAALAVAWLAAAGARPSAAQTTLFDGRFDDLRRASVEWDRRAGPERQV